MSELATKVITTLQHRTLTLAVAESVTGGLIGATLTTVPGASKVYLGGVVSYATRLKTELLDVPRASIDTHTVISEEVAISMAVGLQRRTDADWVIAVTGVAGPDPQDGHEAGEVWICVLGPRIPSLPQFQQVERFDFEGDRDAIREQTVDAACRMLLRVVSPV
ncbi:MAG: CinA family protein [Propionibacteriaceae bacterium]|nr:CinA family protein [Propionibacteriaceae bacterium]